MIRVHHPISKPASFDQRRGVPGLNWLQQNPASQKMPAYWTMFQPELADGFYHRCGWWAMWIADGAVDHFLSRKHHRHLAYSWDNYRYIAGTVNSSKKALDDQVLDPFEIQDGWFEVLLPSMQLVTTPALPAGVAGGRAQRVADDARDAAHAAVAHGGRVTDAARAAAVRAGGRAAPGHQQQPVEQRLHQCATERANAARLKRDLIS